MKRPFLIFALLSVTAYLYCQDENQLNSEVKFMVFSDPHYYDSSLWSEGKALQQYLDYDRKLLRESEELLKEAVDLLGNSDANFVLIPGDLTKDGSRISHINFAKYLESLEEKGKQVYVVPGNHDVLNGAAKALKGDSALTVENIDAFSFETIYADFGYNEALARDRYSLSYVVEPVDGLWILGLDACLYKNNLPGHHPNTDGKFSAQTLAWIDSIAGVGAQEQKRMIAFMHHGIIEHYKGQEKFFGEYIVDDWEKVSKSFTDLGINIVFTGHYHAQDISMKEWRNGNYIIDVETGSLVTYPCPVREVILSDESLKITTQHIFEIPSQNDFEAYSRDYVYSGISGIAEETLISYKMKPDQAAKLSGQIADAFVAHYSGDEIVPDRYFNLKGIGIFGRIVVLVKRKLIVGLYHDLPPADNDVEIPLH